MTTFLFRSADNLSWRIELSFEGDLLTTAYYWGDTPEPASTIRTRGQESNEIIATLKRQGEGELSS